MEGVCAAARAGYAVLQGGGSSVDAVVDAVTQLENNPLFNAGNFSHVKVAGGQMPPRANSRLTLQAAGQC